jgi:glutamate racemase
MASLQRMAVDAMHGVSTMHNFNTMKISTMKRLFLFVSSLLLSAGLYAQKDIQQLILNTPSDYHYIDFKNYPRRDISLPIGVFDSGTGGLTVFDAIVRFDEYNNKNGAKGADGARDFSSEDFIYLADQANMPYGNYSSVGKTDFLKELILKDAQFLLGQKYYQNTTLASDKKPIKALVIACNTATAYGKEYIEALLKAAQSDLKVIGVIDAGARGALELFDKTENGTIGVFATAGTVASGGYKRAIERYSKELGYQGEIQVFSQGGVGLAEAIDEELNFIDKKATTVRPNYRGPNVKAEASLQIDRQLLKIYNFDFAGYKMLCDAKKVDDCGDLQINSAENYVRYHLVSLLEQMLRSPKAEPMKALILGCTHYPYMTQTIRQVLGELRNYKEKGKYRYRKLLAKEVNLVDPSVNTARELYAYLQAEKLNNPAGSLLNSEFYISVPNTRLPGVGLEPDGTRFTYEYKYGRQLGEGVQYTLTAPFSRQNIPASIAERLNQQIPEVYKLIQQFEQQSPKTKFLRPDERL